MTGPTQPADDRRELTIDDAPAGCSREEAFAWLAGAQHGTGRAKVELARLRDEATAAHGRNLVLRSEHRTEVERLRAELTEVRSQNAFLSEMLREAARQGVIVEASEAAAWESSRAMAETADVLSLRLRGMARKVVACRAELHDAVEDWGRNDEQVLAENQRLAAEVERLNLEIQGYQVGDPYERGHEHGVQAALARLSGGNTPADAADLATIDERDAAEEWADRLAYAIAPESVIGVHSSGSNPWAHALNLIEAERAASVPDVADSRKRVFVVDAKSGLRTAMRPGRPVRVQFRVDTDPAVATPARAYGLVDVVPAGVDGVIGARSKRTWYRRPEGWLALERPGDPVRLVSEHSLFVLEGSVSPAPSVGADPEDEVEAARQHTPWMPGDHVEYDVEWHGRTVAIPGYVTGDAHPGVGGVHRMAVQTGKLMVGEVYMPDGDLRVPRAVTKYCGAFDPDVPGVSMKPCPNRAWPENNRCERHILLAQIKADTALADAIVPPAAVADTAHERTEPDA